jgi:hypothetical protein
MQGISWLYKELLNFQEGLCSLEVVKYNADVSIYVSLEFCYMPQATN